LCVEAGVATATAVGGVGGDVDACPIAAESPLSAGRERKIDGDVIDVHARGIGVGGAVGARFTRRFKEKVLCRVLWAVGPRVEAGVERRVEGDVLSTNVEVVGGVGRGAWRCVEACHR
jgi:hypothetical protein